MLKVVLKLHMLCVECACHVSESSSNDNDFDSFLTHADMQAGAVYFWECIASRFQRHRL
jgi:hypothetical protein